MNKSTNQPSKLYSKTNERVSRKSSKRDRTPNKRRQRALTRDLIALSLTQEALEMLESLK